MSILIREKKFAFIHIPKTGGSSLEFHIGGSGHDSISQLLGPLFQPTEEWNVCTIVRNPYDRLVSGYHHVQQRNDTVIKSGETFEKFVAMLPERMWETHFVPQAAFVTRHIWKDALRLYRRQGGRNCN
jgi:hypothetical protein